MGINRMFGFYILAFLTVLMVSKDRFIAASVYMVGLMIFDAIHATRHKENKQGAEIGS